MQYFKSESGEVFAYDAEQVLLGLAADKTSMSDEEVQLHLNPVPTPEQLQAQVNTEARAYLASTDWYVIRLQETGQPVPEDILEARSQARSRVVDIPTGV